MNSIKPALKPNNQADRIQSEAQEVLITRDHYLIIMYDRNHVM